jgi:hypothetical protein
VPMMPKGMPKEDTVEFMYVMCKSALNGLLRVTVT